MAAHGISTAAPTLAHDAATPADAASMPGPAAGNGEVRRLAAATLVLVLPRLGLAVPVGCRAGLLDCPTNSLRLAAGVALGRRRLVESSEQA